MKPSKIELHIEELVLHGFAAHDRHAIHDAIVSQLTTLLAAPGALGGFVDIPNSRVRDANLGLRGSRTSNYHRDRVDGGSVKIPGGASGARTGESLAGAVFGSLKP
jgi:hypothetical protein